MDRKELKEIELRSEELQEIMGRIPSWILRAGITVLFCVVMALLTGSGFFKYPDVIQAPVTLTGSTPPAGVIAFSSGKLDMLHTRDNQEVKAGDYLAVIHNAALTEDVLYLKRFLDELEAWIDDRTGAVNEQTGVEDDHSGIAGIRTGAFLRLLGDRKGSPLHLGNMQALYASFYLTLSNYQEYVQSRYYPDRIQLTKERIVQYGEQYRSLQRQQKIIEEQTALTDRNYERSANMHEYGGISGKELDEARSRQLQGQLTEENMLSSMNNMRIQIAQMNESLIDMEYQHTAKLHDFHAQIRSMVSQLKAGIQAWEMSYVLMAPIDGKISFTNYWVSNQHVQAGEDVFTVIPVSESRPVGKAMLPVARSGKVTAGQKVNIRLYNFPDSEFGMLKGIVNHVSLVPATSGSATYYVVEIALPEGLHTSYKKELPYLPNMQGIADIITEDMSLLERFVMPVRKILMN